MSLPDGSRVVCEVKLATEPESTELSPAAGPYDALLELAGSVGGLPADASENVDHYLYGHAKK